VRKFIYPIYLIGLIIILSNVLMALPRFAAQEGVSCGQCHVNDQGGALRNSYGAEFYSQKVLPMSEWEEFGSDEYTTQFNKFIRFGGDVRVQYYRYVDERTTQSAFFPMQADAYLHIAPSEQLEFFLEQSLFRSIAATDVWAQFSYSGDGGYLRFGQFLPAYGLRLDDHTAFIRGGNVGGITVADSIAGIPVGRQGLHWKPSSQTVGLEAMVKPFGLQLTGSIGKPRNGTEYTAVLNLAHAFWIGDLNFLAGGSYFTGDLAGLGRRYSYYGVYTGINFGRFTYLGEMDFTSDYSQQGATGYAFYSEFSARILQGLDLVASYSMYDPDVELTGVDLKRFILGMDIIPVSYVELKPQYRIITTAADPDYSRSELIIQSHFWF